MLYAITDRRSGNREAFFRQIEQALIGGVTCVQLREKQMEEDAFTEEAVQVKKICGRYGVPLLINDSLTVALHSGADGIHVGMTDCPVKDIRKKVGDDFIIGATAKTVEQARQAEADGADYLGVGAVFPSPTKTDAIRICRKDLKAICESVRIPAIAIGGICHENVNQLMDSGICGIAVVSAIFSAEDIRRASMALKTDVLGIVSAVR